MIAGTCQSRKCWYVQAASHTGEVTGVADNDLEKIVSMLLLGYSEMVGQMRTVPVALSWSREEVMIMILVVGYFGSDLSQFR